MIYKNDDKFNELQFTKYARHINVPADTKYKEANKFT